MQYVIISHFKKFCKNLVRGLFSFLVKLHRPLIEKQPQHLFVTATAMTSGGLRV